MFDQIPDLHLTPERTPTAQTAREFLAHHGHCLPDMIGMLGGPKARTVAFDLIEGVAAGSMSDRQIVTGFGRLLAVLDLRHVGDPSRLEAALFSEIDPAFDIVHDICAMTDAVRKLVSHLNMCGAQVLAGSGRAS
jgi:hypothetical protein